MTRRWYRAMFAAVAVAGCGSAESTLTAAPTSIDALGASTSTAATTPPTERPTTTGPPVATSNAAAAASCVEELSPATLAGRSFAFAGTVVRIRDDIDQRAPEGDSVVARAEFEVDRWFAGGDAPTAWVWMQRDVEVGQRLLVAGEPRWGGEPLEDAIAWECGFTAVYEAAGASIWETVFAGADSDSDSASTDTAPAAPLPTTARSDSITVIDAVVDLSDDVLAVSEPSPVHALDVTAPDPTRPAAVFVSAAPDNRVAVLDVARGTVQFVAAAGGDMLLTRPIELPADMPDFYFGFLVGPDDVLYLLDAHDGEFNRVSAYAARESADGVYRRVAQSQSWVAGVDGQPEVVLGPLGPAFLTKMDEPLLRYVDRDGNESGVSLASSPVSFSFDYSGMDLVHHYSRDTTTWNVTWRFDRDGPPTRETTNVCPPCFSTTGPSAPIVVRLPLLDAPGDDDVVVVVLGTDAVTTHRFRWQFGGVTEHNVILYRFTDRGVEIAIHTL